MTDDDGQLSLYPTTRTDDPDTSHRAAADAYENAATHRGRALRIFRDLYPLGLTDYELAFRTGLQQNSIGKRRGELRDRGLVEDSGIRRPAPSGSMAIVWRYVPQEGSEDDRTGANVGGDPRDRDAGPRRDHGGSVPAPPSS